jgi:hypothetical protein
MGAATGSRPGCAPATTSPLGTATRCRGGGHRDGGRGLLVKRQIVAWRPDENLYGNKIYTN